MYLSDNLRSEDMKMFLCKLLREKKVDINELDNLPKVIYS